MAGVGVGSVLSFCGAGEGAWGSGEFATRGTFDFRSTGGGTCFHYVCLRLVVAGQAVNSMKCGVDDDKGREVWGRGNSIDNADTIPLRSRGVFKEP